MANLIHAELSETIIGAAMRVLNTLKPGLDEKLYEKYGLTNDEITFIESMIRPMETTGE